MTENSDEYISGRGAQINTPDPFTQFNYFLDPGLTASVGKTNYQAVYPKSIINKVDSPDLHFNYSINAYQGCEHGCVYCYARNTHPYWGYSAGLDFESQILYKEGAIELLDKKLSSKYWKAEEIMLSGNTDCYQPIEHKLQLTRSMLKVFWKYRHPVGMITKNSLILRDLDLLKKLASEQLVKVVISITTEDEALRKKLEPRTATSAKRFEVVQKLSEAGIPVMVMIAPVIPGLNDPEVLPIAKKAAEAGARNLSYTMVRLVKDVAPIFEDWLDKTMPARKDKILNHIKSSHKCKLGSSEWKERMRGSGNIAQMVKDQVELARRIYFKGREIPPYNYELHAQYKNGQMSLF